MNTNSETGQVGERAAVDWLRREGFLIMERNWRYGRYELDIIALKDECIRFVEVKTRSVTGWTSPESAIDRSKRNSMIRAAMAYRRLHPSHRNFGFDLAAVDLMPDGSCEVRYIRGII